MISKKSNNTGASGGNSMQSFTVDYLNECELYHEYKKGHVCICPQCGEEYHLNPEHKFMDALKLTMIMREQGCPFCNHCQGLTHEHLNWFMDNKSKVLQLDFIIGEGLELKAFRKPLGWKPLSKAELQEAMDDKEAA